MSQTYYDRTASWLVTDRISPRDRRRAEVVADLGGGDVLDLGTGGGGTAAAMADLGHDVLALERSPARAAIARRLCRSPRRGRLVVLRADYDEFRPERQFDTVTIWSGFGVGPDTSHLALLRSVGAWLRPGGHLVVDVFDPRWWQRHDGELTWHRGVGRPATGQRLTYDAASGRMAVERWLLARPAEVAKEQIRCYSQVELVALADQAQLRVTSWRPSLGPSDPPSALAVLTHAGTR